MNGQEAPTVKIDPNSLIRTGNTQPREDAQKPGDTARPSARNAEPGAQAHLSHHAADPSQDIDTARVDEIRDAIKEGRLDIQADRIADGLIANVRELLGQNNP